METISNTTTQDDALRIFNEEREESRRLMKTQGDAAQTPLGSLEGNLAAEADGVAGHTPTPWHITGDAGHPANIRITATSRRHVAKVYAESLDRDRVCEANAELIVKAVNSYADLVAERDALRRAADFALKYHKMQVANGGKPFPSQLANAIAAALATHSPK